MTTPNIPNLTSLAYQAQNFSDLYDTDLGRDIWDFMKDHDNLIRMQTATFLERAAVEPLGPGLLLRYGPDIAQDRLKQMIGHMARQIMLAMGYELDTKGLRITRPSVFTTATRYRRPDQARDRTMTVTAEQREAWMRNTASSPFNRWLDSRVKREDGTLDLDALYKVAEEHGIRQRYNHLNPGQQRMNIGNRLRKKVDPSEYSSS